MYSDEDMRETYKEGYEKGKADGGYAEIGDGWRDARKELPDAGGDCIVYTLDNRIEIDEYTTNFGWYIDRVGGKVIAWMPLSVIGKPAFA